MNLRANPLRIFKSPLSRAEEMFWLLPAAVPRWQNRNLRFQAVPRGHYQFQQSQLRVPAMSFAQGTERTKISLLYALCSERTFLQLTSSANCALPFLQVQNCCELFRSATLCCPFCSVALLCSTTIKCHWYSDVQLKLVKEQKIYSWKLTQAKFLVE